MKIGALIYTYNRTDDTRINMEIIRNLWSKNDMLKDLVIVHSYNGKSDWWQEKYLEDDLLRLDNPGHFAGAEILLNEGVKRFSEKYPDVDYVIMLASDTWLIDPDYVARIVTQMRRADKYLATCAWGTKKKNNIWNIGMGLDFAIFDLKWAVKYGLFPIRFLEFSNKYSELFTYRDEHIYLERVFALRFKQAIMKSVHIPSDNLLREISEKHLYRMIEREPIHFKPIFGKQRRKMQWLGLGIIGDHDPRPKREVLKKIDGYIGEHAKRLMASPSLDYYNRGVGTIGYGD